MGRSAGFFGVEERLAGLSKKGDDLERLAAVEPLRIPLARPWFDEREPESALAVVRSGMLCQGEKVAEFERAFAAAEGFVNVRQLA